VRLRLAVSACLLGHEVRWNKGHKRESFLTEVVAEHADLVPFCPEDAVLGTPRPTLRLERMESGVRAVTEAGADHTDALLQHGPDQHVHGIILKRASPSCGLDVAIWQDGKPRGRGPGVVAATVVERDIPVTDEGRLREPMWREHFFDQALAWLRWEQLGSAPSNQALTNWHGRNKLTLMSHDPAGAKRLGQHAAAGDVTSYRAALPAVLKVQASRGRHANVLQHIQGYVSAQIDADDRQELLSTIESYHAGLVPLVVPLTLLSHHARRHAPPWLMEQTYLAPYPAEWMLRS
jgi:uncharacterized protein YbgA (DUF1722 family)/uncharacterized protein YbbK (DUF523 family)